MQMISLMCKLFHVYFCKSRTASPTFLLSKIALFLQWTRHETFNIFLDLGPFVMPFTILLFRCTILVKQPTNGPACISCKIWPPGTLMFLHIAEHIKDVNKWALYV